MEMSHSVMMARTNVTTTSTAIVFNTAFLKSFQGVMEILQTILNIILVTIVGYYWRTDDSYQFVEIAELAFLLVSVTLLITTAIMLIACIISIGTPTALPKTAFQYLYHSVGSSLYVCVSLFLLVRVSQYLQFSPDYKAKLACCVLGLTNSGFYLIMTIFSYQKYKRQ